MPVNDEYLTRTRQRWCDFFANDDGRITAWTFIPAAIHDQVLAGRITECTIDHSDDDPQFRAAYQWMIQAMNRSGISAGRPGLSPWWCWVRAGYGYTKPTDRDAGDDQVLLELSVPAHELLLSDFDMWHLPLNYWINAEGEAGDAFERDTHTAGLSIYEHKPLPEPFHSRVQASWLEIFELDVTNGFTGQFSEKPIQGVFWNLRPDIIKGVVQPAVYVELDDESSGV